MGMRIVIIGAVALGPKTACRVKRLMPDAHVLLIDAASRISYGSCGIPYYIGGDVAHVEDLQSTPYGVVRDEEFFRSVKGVEVLTRTQVTAIDRAGKTLSLRSLMDGRVSQLPYDRLVIATGAVPDVPDLPGVNLEGVTTVVNLEQAEAVERAVSIGTVNKAAVIGSGYMALELAVALGDMWAVPTSLLATADQLLPGQLPASLAKMVEKDLCDHRVTVHTGEKILRFEGENGAVKRVVTDTGVIEADLVLLAPPMRPNTQLAAQAGLALTEGGLIETDAHMRSSDPYIYAGGDCAALCHAVTGKQSWMPYGSLANRQGRVLGSNLAGGNVSMPPATGAWGVKLFSQSASGSGLTLEEAKQAGFDAVSVQIQHVDKAHFYPEHTMMSLELVVEKASRRVLGIQGVAGNGDALTGRINAVTPLLIAQGTAHDLTTLELVYAPPFGSAMDAVNVLGCVAENILDGLYRPFSPEEFMELWKNRADEKVFFLDVRSADASEAFCTAFPRHWHAIPQNAIAKSLADIPKDKPIVLMCNTGLRSYETQSMLDTHGFTDTHIVAGGVVALSRMGLELIEQEKVRLTVGL